MQLTVELNDDELKNAIVGGIEKLSNETITELAKTAISAFLSKPDVIWDLIFKKPGNSYNSWRETRNEPAPWFTDMLTNSFSQEEVEQYRKMIFNTLEEHKRDIVVDAMAQCFSKSLISYDMQLQLAHLLSERYGTT